MLASFIENDLLLVESESNPTKNRRLNKLQNKLYFISDEERLKILN
jgi:hypothetical protein